MKRVLLTGMSGTGKSSVVRELVARGFTAIDTDDGWCEPTPDGRQRWRLDAISAFLDADDADDAGVLFVAGCEENQVELHPRFDTILLLSAPLTTLLERLDARTDNPYGKTGLERRRVLDDVATVEPLLRRVADHEVLTTVPLEQVVDTVLRLVAVRTEPAPRADPASP